MSVYGTRLEFKVNIVSRFYLTQIQSFSEVTKYSRHLADKKCF